MRICNVQKQYEKFSLRVDSLEFRHNRVYGIIGPNGCGKTTLMKIMAGLLVPDSGSVESDGLQPRDITMVFRKPYLLHDTVANNLVYPLRIRKIKPDKGLVDHYLEISGLQNYRNQYAPGLSGGEQQRLAMIRAMIFSPKMILVDEALSSMDIESVAFFTNYILDMQKKDPVTWVIISHQLSCIKQLCDHVYFMDNGRVEAQGEPSVLLDSPANDNLKRYLRYL